MTKVLSTKWYNVIRRQLRATPVTYVGDPPPCPDCGCETDLREGRYGRFYECENLFACTGTVGARLDGTPRQPRGTSPELLQARLRARDAVHAVILEASRRAKPDTQWHPGLSYSDVGILLDKILKRARVWEDPGWLIPTTSAPGLMLRKRNLRELARIEAAAHEELRLLRWTPYWDRLSGDVLQESAPT